MTTLWWLNIKLVVQVVGPLASRSNSMTKVPCCMLHQKKKLALSSLKQDDRNFLSAPSKKLHPLKGWPYIFIELLHS